MNINELSKESHEIAVEKGFYDCPECEGDGEIIVKEQDWDTCESCNGTGIDQNKNIPELLMLVITEIGEAVESLRCGKFTEPRHVKNFIKKYDQFIDEDAKIDYFDKCIKDTFEDEIADVFIRLFDLCGYLGIESNGKTYTKFILPENISEQLFNITKGICLLPTNLSLFKSDNLHIISDLKHFCEHNNIDIEKHIAAKMEYNKSRPRR